jgi:Transglutaminase-like superfamily
MNNLAKFMRLDRERRVALIEASLWLLLARAGLRLLPFRRMVGLATRPRSAPTRNEAEIRAILDEVRWAVRAGAHNGPGLAVCFPQGIAAQRMLARRGVPSTLHYGVAKSGDGSLEAHVWVRAAGQPVVGCETAARFTLMTTFPREADALASASGGTA